MTNLTTISKMTTIYFNNIQRRSISNIQPKNMNFLYIKFGATVLQYKKHYIFQTSKNITESPHLFSSFHLIRATIQISNTVLTTKNHINFKLYHNCKHQISQTSNESYKPSIKSSTQKNTKTYQTMRNPQKSKLYHNSKIKHEKTQSIIPKGASNSSTF